MGPPLSCGSPQMYKCYAPQRACQTVRPPVCENQTRLCARIAMPKLDDQISTLQERLNQLKLRQQRLDARKRATEAQRERKAETRRKILVGGIVLARFRKGEIDGEQFRGWLDDALTRADDRALFDLSPTDSR